MVGKPRSLYPDELSSKPQAMSLTTEASRLDYHDSL